MYESKYRKYITHNSVRFAEENEIIKGLVSIENGSGIPLYSQTTNVFVDNSDNHTIVIGPTGCKKTRLTVMTTVASIINRGESAVINDPKGEIYRQTAGLAKRRAADVYVYNMRNTKKSHSWNPLYQAHRSHSIGESEEAIQYVNDFAEALVLPALKCTNDKYWIDCAKQLLIHKFALNSIKLFKSDTGSRKAISKIMLDCLLNPSDILKVINSAVSQN